MPASFLEVVQTISEDERFSEWELGSGDETYRELRQDRVVLVLAAPELWQDRTASKPHWVRARSGNYTLILCGDADQIDAAGPAIADELASTSVLLVPITPARLDVELSSVFRAHSFRLELADRELAIERARYERDLLIDVGRFLSQERDINALLQRILTKARAVTGADAGSVYIVEGDDDDPANRILHFVASQNDSRAIESGGFTMPVSPSSIVGACVMSGDVINIPDLYSLDQPGTGNNPWGFIHDRTWDQQIAYETRSMLTVPMISARGQVIGVIQLINKRARGVLKLTRSEDFKASVLPFDSVSINYADTLASQAGIALENALLYNEVQTLFEGFVHASVSAIEARDPTTSGHSERVAELTVGLARAADRADGQFAELYYTGDDIKQIEYAALLHDFGKVGVRENVLVKAEKLYPWEKELIEARFQFIRKCVEAEALEAKVRFVMETSREEWEAVARDMDRDSSQRVEELDDFIAFILQANRPSLLGEGGFERLADIAERTYVDPAGVARPYLTREEVTALQISRGSLTAEEREEIESHVVHSYNFLKQIPWGRTLRDVPEIAGSHHEKLDGTGYPLGLEAHEIPTPTKMMTIADIFDALTASDRPYKRAVPLEMALDIIKSEVDRGKVDGELFQLFVDAKIWNLVVTP
jgi:HD-GYP domain-containing protein (c-di-GMP phosphodiesterase class II)